MSLSKDQIQQKFNRTNVKKRDLPVYPKSLQEYLQFMDYKIRKEFKSFTLLSLCGGAERGGFLVEKNFDRAFGTMTLGEKTEYYAKFVDNIQKAASKIEKAQATSNGKIEAEKPRDPISMRLKVGKESKAFEETQITIQDCVVRSKAKGLPDIDLRNYLLRKSKKKNLYCYALQAIRPSDIDTIRFAFLSGEDESKYLPVIQSETNEASYSNIERQLSQYLNKRKSFPNEQSSKQVKLKNDSKDGKSPLDGNFLNIQANPLRNSRKPDLNKSVIEDIVKSRDEQELDEELTEFINDQNEELERLELEKKKSEGTPYFQQYRNIFRIMLPSYNLKQVSKFNHYGSIYQSKLAQFYVYLNAKDHSQLKMQFIIDLPLEVVCKAIYNVQLYKYWHPEIDEGQIKLKISSENSCITYLKTKAFSQWYRDRDYLLLTHMFRMQNAYYIVEKSIENANYIPFQSITRGKFLYIVWKIEPEHSPRNSKGKAVCRVTVDLKVNHEGLLNKNHQRELSLRHLKGFENMEDYYQKPENQKKLTDIMGFHWTISDRESYRQESQNEGMNLNSLRTCDFQDASEISENEQDEVFYSIEDLSEDEKEQQHQEQEQRSEHEIEPEKLQSTSMMQSQLIGGKNMEQNIVTDAEGLVVLPKKYLKKKQIVQPFDTEKILMEFPYDNILEKDHWVTEKGGGLKLINQVKISAQNNVLKFIMKTLKKNLFSGKGILNISLPVEIFNVDSNLQRICASMSLGPEFLEPVAKATDHLERFKKVLAFGLSNSIIYFDVEKPFNPILGQTYQGYIRGCPIYAEQISHHPPITSAYFIGRGYKVTCNLEAVVHVHMNSGDGINEGLYHVIFDDGHQIVFQTPPAEISGLAVGDRRFNYKDRGIYFDLKNLYFCQMRLEAAGGLFSKKKREFTDQIEGQILKVKPEFLRKYMEAKMDKKPSPSQSEIVEKLGELSGRWSYELKIDGVPYYNIRKNVPDKMIDEVYPLNSNSNYREDLLYRKKNDLSRSQIQKQRLEIIQRGDRKLRQKFHGPAKH